MVITLLLSCCLKKTMQKKESKNINISVSVTDAKNCQERAGRLETLHMVNSELGEAEVQKKIKELYQLFLDGEISVE